MTITTNDTRNEYTATGGQTDFDYTFKIFASTDLNVYQVPSGVTAVDATHLITAYTVSGVGNAAGGTVTLDSGATAGDKITIVSNISYERDTDYQNNGDFSASTVNNEGDRDVALIKQLKNIIDRTPQFQESAQGVTGIDWAAPVNDNFIRWRDNGDGTFSVVNVSLNTAEDATNAAAVSVSDSGGYFTGTDVEAVLQELGDDVADLATLSGVAAGSTNLGTFTGSTISDNTTVKGALQELETAVEANWELISTTTTTAASSIDITLDSATYKTFRLEFEVGFSVDSTFSVRLGHTGGTVFYSGATDYGYLRSTISTPSRHDADSIYLNIQTDAAAKLSGEIFIYAAGSTTSATRYKAFYSFEDTTTAQIFCDISGILTVATGTAVDAVRLIAGSGTFDASDTIKLYGLRS